jgi:hypothetical protein
VARNLILAFYVLGTFVLFTHFALAHDLSHYPQEAQNWFKQQKRPGGGALCCSEADFDQVDEEIRYESGKPRYWISSDKTHGRWLLVPAEAIIQGPNLHGRAVAWFRWVSPDGSFTTRQRDDLQVEVFCFSPGPLL